VKELSVAALFAAVTTASFCGHATFTQLSPTVNQPYDVSDKGSVVVGQGAMGAVLWSQADGAIPVDFSANTYVHVSSDGKTLAGTVGPTQNASHAYRWSAGGGLIDLGVPAGGQWSSAFNLSGDGTTVVGLAGGGTIGAGYHAFRWTQETGMVDLDTMGGPNSEARAVSFDGSIVTGGMKFAGGYQAFLWQDGVGVKGLGTLDGGQSIGLALNSTGTIVVGGVYGTSNAFRWTASEGMVSLGHLSTGSNQAYGVSDDGSTIVGLSAGQGFLWTPATGMQNLLQVMRDQYGLGDAVANWTTVRPEAVSPDGRYIVGSGTFGGWLLDRGDPTPFTPVPEPPLTGVLSALGLTGLWLKRVRFSSRS
jgi:probable HAF family extracellular repeat protein